MYNDLRSMYICYPFMTVDSIPDWFKYVKDMRIVVTLPAMQAAHMDQNRENIKITLTSISHTTAIIKLSCASYWITDKEISIPVFTNTLPGTPSFVCATEVLPTLTGLSYDIHPACLVFMQKAPVLWMEQESRNGEPYVMVELEDGVPVQKIYNTDDRRISDVLRLMNGKNVGVTGSSSSVLFTCGVGLGSGTYQKKPYTEDPETFTYAQGKRLRSINGQTGDVLISGDRSVEITNTQATISIKERRLQ